MLRAMTTVVLLAAAMAAPAHAQGPISVGGGTDAHGCYASAGYSWSILKKSCIRMWEAGVRLNPVTPQGSAVMSAFVVFASESDRRQAELFLVNLKGSLLLTKVRGARAWSGEGYRLTAHKGVYSLFDAQGTLIYQGPN